MPGNGKARTDSTQRPDRHKDGDNSTGRMKDPKVHQATGIRILRKSVLPNEDDVSRE